MEPAGYALRGMRRWANVENASVSFLDPLKYISFKYVAVVAQSTATTAGSQTIWKINSIYDPDGAVGGHQPYGYDQLTALYGRYRVLKTRWRVAFGTSTGTMHVVVLPVSGALANSIASDTTFQTACEMPRARSAVIGGGGSPAINLNGTIDLPALTGATITEYKSDDRYSAAINTDPSTVMYLYVGYYNPTASTVVIQTRVELEFFCELYQPIAQGGSTLKLTDEEQKAVEIVRRINDKKN